MYCVSGPPTVGSESKRINFENVTHPFKVDLLKICRVLLTIQINETVGNRLVAKFSTDRREKTDNISSCGVSKQLIVVIQQVSTEFLEIVFPQRINTFHSKKKTLSMRIVGSEWNMLNALT